MNRNSPSDQHVRKRPPLRRFALALASITVCSLLAAIIGAVAFYHAGSIVAGLELVHSARPWFIAIHLVTLAFLWTFWHRLVPAFVRWRGLSDSAAAALTLSKHRIFMLFGACETLLVFRALFA